MPGAFVRVAGAANNLSTVTSIDVALSGTTSGNLLVGVFATGLGNGGATTPSGWTLIHTQGTGTATGGVYYRIADGTETNVTFSWTSSREVAATVCEYSGLDTSSPLEASGENTTYLSTEQTGGVSINGGSATPATANGIAIAFYLQPDERDSNESELSIDSGYTINDFEVGGAGNNAVVAIASKPYTTTAAQSPNWSSSAGAAWRAYTVIAVFKEAAGGSYTLDILPATVTVTGAALTPSAARNITPSGATIAVTGAPLTLDADRVLDLTPATVLVTGAALTLTYTPAAGAYVLDPLPATVAVTGAALTLDADRVLTLGEEALPGLLPFVATSAGLGTRFASPSGSGSLFTIGSPGPVRTAISGAVPGDVVFLRGGVYDIATLRVTISVSGTAAQPIIIESYPGETAIFEGLVSGSTQNVEQVVYLLGDYIQLRNIEIRNSIGYAGLLVEATAADNLIEHVYVHDCIGSGIQNYGDRNRFLSCTANDNSDVGYTDGTFNDGGNSDGFSVSRGHLVRVEHCVALRNSDDGIDMWGALDGYVGYCISASNGLGTLGNGNGIKAGGYTPSGPTLVEHCLSYSNRDNGFDTNSINGVTFRKNTAYLNGGDGFWLNNDVNVVDNNSRDNTNGDTGGATTGTVSNNSWQRGGTLTFMLALPGTSDYLRPTVGGGFEDIGAYSPIVARTAIYSGKITLAASRVLTPVASAIGVTGVALTLTYTAPVVREITPLPAAIAVTGTAITLTYGAINNRVMSPMAAEIIVSPKNLKLEYSGVNLLKINGVVI